MFLDAGHDLGTFCLFQTIVLFEMYSDNKGLNGKGWILRLISFPERIGVFKVQVHVGG